MLRRLLLCAIAVTMILTSAWAQRIAESVEVTVIEVPVTVRDRAGNTIRDLTKENFEVLVDGKRVPIEYFEAIDLTKISASAEQPAPPAAYRNFLLMFDMANSSPTGIGRAQDAAKQFVERELGERDLAAVATFTAESGARMVTSFTRDKELLANAIVTLGLSDYFKVADPLLLSADLSSKLPGGETGSGSGNGANAKADALAANAERLREFNERTSIANDNELRGRIRNQLKNFGGVARTLDRLKGQKQIILLSEGFDSRLLTGRADLSFKATQEENDAVMSGEVWKVDTEKRFGSASEAKDIDEMVELFRRSDVRLHAIDIKGLRSDVDAREGLKKSSNESLFLLTRPTGGTVFRNSNDLSDQFKKLMSQQEVIYLLGFNAKDAKPGAYHPLKVKLVGAKGEISHRSGYYDAARLSNLEATLNFSQMLMTGAEVRDVPMTIVATPVPGSGAARVPVVVELSGSELLKGVEGNTANASLFVYAFDAKGEVADFMQQRLALDLGKTGTALRATGVRYVGGLRLPPGAYAIKTLARVEETGRIGLTTANVVVPEYGATAVLPPVAVGKLGQWVTVVSPTRGNEATGVLTLGARPMIPAAKGELGAGLDNEIALLLKGIAVENLGIAPALVRPDGSTQTVTLEVAGRTAADAEGLTKLLLKIKPDGIAPGDYDLRLGVTPKGGAETTVSVPVVVR